MNKPYSCKTCGRPCGGKQCRACYTDPNKQRPPKQKRSITNTDYVVYCLYTEVAGVFYIGCGRVAHDGIKSRLSATLAECNNTSVNCMKCQYVRACQKYRIGVHQEVVFQCGNKQRAEEVEYALIQRYPYVLTNTILNWHPMYYLPAFLLGLQEEPKEEVRLGTQESLLDEEARYAETRVKYEHIKLVVDAIIAYNDATSEPSLRWYINEKVVCELLGGQPLKETSHLVRRYLARRRDEITAHHQKHRLLREHNRKRLSIVEYVKIEPAMSRESAVER